MRVLLAAAALPVLAGFAAIAALLAVIAAFGTQASFSPEDVLLASGPGWLAAYQVPITIGGRELGLLPLAATFGIAVLLARSASGAAERLDCRTPHDAVAVIGTMAGAHAVVGCTVSLVANGAYATADPLAAFCMPGLLAGVSAAAGLARRSGLVDAVRPYTDAAAVAGIRAGMLGLAWLIAVGAAVLAVVSVFSAPTMHTLFEASAPGFGSGLGMLLLCVLYLPNAVLATLGFAVGPGFSFGTVWVSPAGFEGGDVPAIPLLAGMPDAPAGWWAAVLVLPAAVGVLVGWTLRDSSPDPFARLRSAGVAGAVVGFLCVLLGALAGGRVASHAGLVLPLGLLSVAAFCWIAVPAAVVAWFAGPRPERPAEPEAAEDPEPEDPEPEADEEGHLGDEAPPEEGPEGQEGGEVPNDDAAEGEVAEDTGKEPAPEPET